MNQTILIPVYSLLVAFAAARPARANAKVCWLGCARVCALHVVCLFLSVALSAGGGAWGGHTFVFALACLYSFLHIRQTNHQSPNLCANAMH